jgi:hypothetical protein
VQARNAVECLDSNGNLNLISDALGDRHKVRSFYNNILHPNAKTGDVTATMDYANPDLDTSEETWMITCSSYSRTSAFCSCGTMPYIFSSSSTSSMV